MENLLECRLNIFEVAFSFGYSWCFGGIEECLDRGFFLFYGDTVMDVALDKMYAFHTIQQADATLFLHPNDHPYDSDLVEIDKKGVIIGFHSKPHPKNFLYRNLVNAALYILSPRLLLHIPQGIKSDFGKDIFPKSTYRKFKIDWICFF